MRSPRRQQASIACITNREGALPSSIQGRCLLPAPVGDNALVRRKNGAVGCVARELREVGGWRKRPGSSAGATICSAGCPDARAGSLNTEMTKMNEARDTNILPKIGAATHAFTREAIVSVPRGDNTPIDKLILQFPGVSYDFSTPDRGACMNSSGGNAVTPRQVQRPAVGLLLLREVAQAKAKLANAQEPANRTRQNSGASRCSAGANQCDAAAGRRRSRDISILLAKLWLFATKTNPHI